MFIVTDLVGRPFWQHHDRLYRLVAKMYAATNEPQRTLQHLLKHLDIPAAERIEARAAVTTPMAAVNALVPGLSLADVSLVLEALETAIGNGFGPAPETVTWPMLAEMRRAGWVIGSHTQTHPSLPTENAATIVKELEGSKHELERRLGEPVTHFAYPGGQFTPAIVDFIRAVGYQFGYTACPHADDRYPSLTIERLLLWEGSSVGANGQFSPDILNCQAHGLWPPWRLCRVHHG
jgi:peptidoglycan/xylan/chitin deacetylase (PgdA/CDA1 family)